MTETVETAFQGWPNAEKSIYYVSKNVFRLGEKAWKVFCVESVYVRCKPALALCCHIE